MDCQKFWGTITLPVDSGTANHVQSFLSSIGPINNTAQQLGQFIQTYNVDPVVAGAALNSVTTANTGKNIVSTLDSVGNQVSSHIDGMSSHIDGMSSQLSDNLGQVKKGIFLGNIINAAGFTVLATQLHGIRKDLRNQSEKVLDHLQSIEKCLEKHLLNISWQVEKQEKWLKGILEILSNSRGNECSQLIKQGEQNYDNGFLPEAENRFTLALEYDNTNPLVHYQLGLLYLLQKQHDKAFPHLNKSVKFAPTDQPQLVSSLLRSMARYYYADSNFSEALAIIEKSLTAYPTNEARFDKILYLLAIGNSANISILIHELLQQSPDYYYLFFYSDDMRGYLDLISGMLQTELDEIIIKAQMVLSDMEKLCKHHLMQLKTQKDNLSKSIDENQYNFIEKNVLKSQEMVKTLYAIILKNVEDGEKQLLITINNYDYLVQQNDKSYMDDRETLIKALKRRILWSSVGIWIVSMVVLFMVWYVILISSDNQSVSGQLKPASNGHFLKPKTSHPVYRVSPSLIVPFCGLQQKGTIDGEHTQDGEAATDSSTYESWMAGPCYKS